MKIGAYQFEITGDMEENLRAMERGIRQAAQKGVRLLAFPECALTGYPPRDIDRSDLIDFDKMAEHCQKLQRLAGEQDMYIVAGTISQGGARPYNSAVAFAPNGKRVVYHKRGLWGWDRDNFCPGTQDGILEVDGIRIGLRICYEIRFPEYFRELYREDTRLNIVLFYDVTDSDDMDRHDLIRAHIRVRATENACHTLAVNTCGTHQACPTGLYDRSGGPLLELDRGKEGLLVYDLELQPPNFGEQGRIEISDLLLDK